MSSSQFEGRSSEKGPRMGVGFKQRFDFPPQLIIFFANSGQEGDACLRRAFQHLVKQAVYLGPAFSVHK